MARKQARASYPKVRTGCLVCRQRRIKCDETKPKCKRCSISGWTCEYSKNSTASGDALEKLNIRQYVIPFNVPGDQASRKALHNFCTNTALDLSGSSHTDFWRIFVLQRCQHESVVRQAVVALSSVHLDYMSAEDLASNGMLASSSTFTLQHYDKAVCKLRKYISSNECVSREVVLTCCACFVAFELIRGDTNAASTHLQNGIGVLRSWQAEESSRECGDDLASLVDMFDSYKIQAYMFDGDRTTHVWKDPRSKLAYTIPQRFNDIASAQRGLRHICDEALNHLVISAPYKLRPRSDVPKAMLEAKEHLRQLLASAKAAMDALVADEECIPFCSDPARRDGERRQFNCAIAEIRLQQHTLEALVACSLNSSSSDCPFDLHAEDILHWARCAANAQSSSTARRCFSLGVGIMLPLFLLALATSNTNVRERTIALMLDARLAEGFCNHHYLVQIIRRLEARHQQQRIRTVSGCKDDPDAPPEMYADPMGVIFAGDALGIGGLLSTSYEESSVYEAVSSQHSELGSVKDAELCLTDDR